MPGMIFPEQYRDGLEHVLAAVQDVGPTVFRTFGNVVLVAENVRTFLAANGVDVTLGQAEEIYALYSQDKCASWMSGGTTVEEAGMSVIELCQSVQEGENRGAL